MSIKGGSYFERQAEMIAVQTARRVRNYAYRTKEVYHFQVEDTMILAKPSENWCAWRYMRLSEIPEKWIEERRSKHLSAIDIEGETAIFVLHSDSLVMNESLGKSIARMIWKDSVSVDSDLKPMGGLRVNVWLVGLVK